MCNYNCTLHNGIYFPIPICVAFILSLVTKIPFSQSRKMRKFQSPFKTLIRVIQNADSSTVPRYILVRENMPVRGLGVDSHHTTRATGDESDSECVIFVASLLHSRNHRRTGAKTCPTLTEIRRTFLAIFFPSAFRYLQIVCQRYIGLHISSTFDYLNTRTRF